MKAATRYLVLLSMLVVGCGDATEGEVDGEGDGGGSESALKCDAVGWCSTWDADGAEVTDAPPLNGGTLSDGLYRRERGSSYPFAMLVKGKSILLIEADWRNDLGTWKVENGRLVMTMTSRCSNTENETSNDPWTWTHAFAVKNGVLYTQDLTWERPTVAWRKVESLCDESASFKCMVSNCACEFTRNTPLLGQKSCS
ncbi:hypothetical protein D7X74_14035 [Corallococcus sp. CA047B]|uniref:hypothetical protein n=1 Tax=Corallococcus sp. CA047B TaxID=2316729 RepID=UPI000EA3070A|nr:hypothetical protein [Corallococcus sp. CA047B]RKH16931.1 hypothetical protein D7X74_14035 [Corallococcus sp. CA047B]